MPDDPVTTTTIPRRHRIRRLLKSNVLIVIMIIASTVQGVAFYGRTSDIIECQRVYQTGFADALDARSTSAAAAQETLDELWTKVAALISGAPGAEPRRQFLAALDSYLQKRAEAKKQQQLNPYPPSPRDLCQ